ncbi:cysteine--tRNA ligase [Devosia psychrophila]|uniref:Cysteine--tRNA ligase n=1 Tax=Devosia psychrophila TaxID=728005 RepID=A0A0F5Q0W1_9HYPH|nr:cysteine--tRNA ligase [Devosia psychrophila]KKC34281.1 cysteine--tRNA ligase [Devosia psychrophila]SFC41645.1 cysteinyl-tRNA synthetase [Devosia psychrophila]
MTTLALYNTLTRTKEAFAPIDANNVRMYVCGPTVYDFAHIGNARPVIVFDLLFRLLRHTYGVDHVTYVRNITDVDDKINARALRDFPDLPLNEAIRRVTEKTEKQFLSDASALGSLEPTIQPRATDNIEQMQTLISDLIAKKHAYNASGEVLFDVKSMPEYGQLSGRNLDDNLAGARIAVEAHKKNPADFVLWKQSSASEPGWDSPWGRGRPGWHIECSAMSERYLGQTFDIHGGGLDLIFPHHENEIAQSRCAHGTHAMANVWMHNGFLQVEGQKMSKSLGNFVTINELLETGAMGGRAWIGDVLRLAMLMTHYREPIDFSVSRLEEAESKLRDWQRAARGAELAEGDDPDASVVKELTDDLNFHRASVALDFIAKKANRDEGNAKHCLASTLRFLGFGLDSLLTSEDGWEAPPHIAAAIADRLAALNSKDFAKADTIRNALAEQGIALMDYKDEAGERQTKWEMKR